MHFYDTQNNRQENFAHIQAGAMGLVFFREAYVVG